MPFTSVKLPKRLPPRVLATSAKDGVSSASTSVIVRSPVAVTSASPSLPSVTAPMKLPETTEGSSTLFTVIVIWPSDAGSKRLTKPLLSPTNKSKWPSPSTSVNTGVLNPSTTTPLNGLSAPILSSKTAASAVPVFSK